MECDKNSEWLSRTVRGSPNALRQRIWSRTMAFWYRKSWAKGLGDESQLHHLKFRSRVEVSFRVSGHLGFGIGFHLSRFVMGLREVQRKILFQ